MKLTDPNISKVILALMDNCEKRMDYIDEHSIHKAGEVCEIIDMIEGDGELNEIEQSTAIEYMDDLRWGFKTLCDFIITLYKDNTEEE